MQTISLALMKLAAEHAKVYEEIMAYKVQRRARLNFQNRYRGFAFHDQRSIMSEEEAWTETCNEDGSVRQVEHKTRSYTIYAERDPQTVPQINTTVEDVTPEDVYRTFARIVTSDNVRTLATAILEKTEDPLYRCFRVTTVFAIHLIPLVDPTYVPMIQLNENDPRQPFIRSVSFPGIDFMNDN